MVRRSNLLVACIALWLGGCAGVSPRAPLAAGVDATAIDPAVRAQDDLFQHANGRWLNTVPLPPDKAYIGAGMEVVDATRDQLRQIAEAAARAPTDADTAKVGALYASFMDEPALERLGLAPLATELARIDAVADRRSYAALMAHLMRLGAGVPIALGVGQDDRDSTRYVAYLSQAGLALPNRDYYLDDAGDARFAAARAAYLRYATRLLVLAGQSGAAAAADAVQVLALETEIARVQWTAVETRDPVKAYNPVAFDRLPALAPGVDWSAWLAEAGLDGRAAGLLVSQPTYLASLAGLLDTTPLAHWKAYAKVHLIDAYAAYLSAPFVDARFAFVGTALSGAERNVSRWERGVRLVDASIGDAFGQPYVARYFPAVNRARIEAMVKNLLAACRDNLQSADWMGTATRAEALAKLAKFGFKIGYPKRWIDYSALELKADDLVGNVMRARVFERDRQLGKLGQPIDREEWQMRPQTVNAYYDASMNEIVFPAAFLQAPFFVVGADDAYNYGAVGAVIGHEISHGFDDQGSQYDGDGNLRDWWTAADRARFDAKTAALVRQYSAFVAIAPDQHVNGELTLGENIADNAGLALAWRAWQRSLGGRPAPVVDGLGGAERFFLGYAQSWRGKERDSALLSQIRSDPHAPDRFRVTGAVRNLPEFHSTFGVGPGDGMYLPPEERVSIW